MAHRYPLLILLTALTTIFWGYGSYQQFSDVYLLPFNSKAVDTHALAIVPIPGVPLPAGIRAGDRIDLPAMDIRSRIAVGERDAGFALTRGQTYELVILQAGKRVTLPVTTMAVDGVPNLRSVRQWLGWTGLGNFAVLFCIALVTFWRGRGRAAAGLALWAISMLAGNAGITVAVQGISGLGVTLVDVVFFLLARVGFYVLVESMISTALTSRSRRLWRGGFLFILVIGAAREFADPVLFATQGWTSLAWFPFELMWVVAYLVPVVMLFASYRSTEPAQRLRLRWMLWSGAVWVFGIFMNDTRVLGMPASYMVGNSAQLFALLGFLYAVLRHRVVNVAVFIDRTLVYGFVTALVVGVLAAVNSIIQHAALGSNASLLLQVAVPLSLGIVLSQVRVYADRIVERVFFRRKYLAEKALRRFARCCGAYENAEDLLAAAVQTIGEKLGAPGIAIYARRGDEYLAVSRGGKFAYPRSIPIDDAAFTATRAGLKDIDLLKLRSALGDNGYVFPIGTQAALVVANRPGEHYSADARKLLAYLARQVGVALHNINVRESLDFVRALARGVLDPAAAREQALKLETGWAES